MIVARVLYMIIRCSKQFTLTELEPEAPIVSLDETSS